MYRFAIGTLTVGILAGTAIGMAGTAAAAPLGGSSAADAVQQLKAHGYSVQINGDQNAPLSECTVTGVSGLSGTNSKGQAVVPMDSTVYVGISCDDDHDE